MLFHTFSSQEERRKFGGSYFIEFQHCKWEQGIDKIISIDNIENWKDDSLYIYGDDDNMFMSNYGDIFTDGTYSNGNSGTVDMCGINYYSKECTGLIIDRIRKIKPLDYQVLLDWLEISSKYNGFYILGL